MIGYIENNEIKIRVLRPEMCFPRYRADDYNEMLYCVVKWYDFEDSIWKAEVFRPDTVEYYELSEAEESEQSVWELIDEQPNLLGFIPIIHVKNTIDDLEFNLNDMVSRYNRDVFLVEIGGDYTEEQRTYDMLGAAMDIVRNIPNDRGLGVIYWEPTGAKPWSGYQLSAWRSDGTPSRAMKAFLDF